MSKCSMFCQVSYSPWQMDLTFIFLSLNLMDFSCQKVSRFYFHFNNTSFILRLIVRTETVCMFQICIVHYQMHSLMKL